MVDGLFGCGGTGIGIAFLLFLILVLLVVGFSFWGVI